MTDIQPTCPDTHILGRDTCTCSPKKAAIKTKKHKSKLLVTAKPKSKVPGKKTQKKQPSVRKRCPNGTHKDKKTGKCISKTLKKSFGSANTSMEKPITAKPEAIAKKLISIKNNTPLDDQLISDAIAHSIEEAKTKKSKTFNELLPEVRQDLIQMKSFSPSVNKRLISLRTVQNTSIFGCGIEDILHGKKPAQSLKIRVKTSASGIPVCVGYRTKAAKDLLLKNLAASKTFDCMKVVAPLQIQSNCWFNTMYMVFFVSDKGRKFFRFLRQLMILGVQENGAIIKPVRLAQSLFLFNAYIESSYNLGDSAKDVMAEGMNTNIIIETIYNSIPKKSSSSVYKMGLRKRGQYGNPLDYYQALITYLSNSSLTLYRPGEYTDVAKSEVEPLLRPHHEYDGEYYMPDIIVVRTYDDIPDYSDMVFSSKTTTRQLSFTRKYVGPKENIPKGKPKEAKYVLDAAIVRSTNQKHFCALITCNGQDMGFDGASLGRLGPFAWKKYLNQNIPWKFQTTKENSYTTSVWNFRDGYQQLYYYRA